MQSGTRIPAGPSAGKQVSRELEQASHLHLLFCVCLPLQQPTSVKQTWKTNIKKPSYSSRWKGVYIHCRQGRRNLAEQLLLMNQNLPQGVYCNSEPAYVVLCIYQEPLVFIIIGVCVYHMYTMNIYIYKGLCLRTILERAFPLDRHIVTICESKPGEWLDQQRHGSFVDDKWLWVKNRVTPNGTLASGNMDQNLWSPGGFF